MAFHDFLERFCPEMDPGDISLWESGLWDWKMIFPSSILYVPDIYREILDESYGSHLPQNYLYFYRCGREYIWVCRFCNFWCDRFDQRIMETHLVCKCPAITEHVKQSLAMKIFQQDRQFKLDYDISS